MNIIITIEGPCAWLPSVLISRDVIYVEWLWLGIGIIFASFSFWLEAMRLPEEEELS